MTQWTQIQRECHGGQCLYLDVVYFAPTVWVRLTGIANMLWCWCCLYARLGCFSYCGSFVRLHGMGPVFRAGPAFCF